MHKFIPGMQGRSILENQSIQTTILQKKNHTITSTEAETWKKFNTLI